MKKRVNEDCGCKGSSLKYPKGKLREYIKTIIVDSDGEEDEETTDEATTTLNVPGYNTPYAFSGDSEEDEEKRKKKLKKINKQYGYTLVQDVTSPEAIQDFLAFFGPLAKNDERIRKEVKKLIT
jgi:hypothetical protein